MTLMTANPRDFEPLHAQQPDHAGILAVYQDNDPRDMSYNEMARAIQNVQDAEIPIEGAFIVLNHWRY